MRRCGERICCNGPCPALCLDPRFPSSCLTCARGMPSGAPLVIRRRQCRQCRQCRGAALLLPLLGPVLCFGFSVERRPALLPAREVSRVVPASAPPGSSGRSDEFGPRRAVGSKDVDGRGVQHELPSFGPFLFLEDALLPRGSMPPFGKHPHAGLLSLTLLLRGDCVQPWDNIHGECATLHPGGMYVVDSAAGVVHSEDRVIANPDDSGAATHAIFLWLDPGIFLERPSTLATSDVFLPAEIPAVTEQGGLTVRVLLGRYLGRTSAFGHLHSKVELIECELAAGGTQQVIHVPHDRPLALIFVPRFGGEGLFGLAQTRVEELETAVLTGEGSFLSVRNAAPDKPLRFLLAAAPEADGTQEAVALYAHNGAVFAATEEAARSLMHRYEREGEGFGDPFAKLAAPNLAGGRVTPEKMDMESFEQYFDEDSSAEPAATFAAAVSGQQLTRQLIDAVSAKFPAKNISVSPVRASEALARASKGS